LIEQAIFSCIGFLLAALLALAAAPAIARRARRLAEARARLQAPLSETQAIAERDALRAQHAVDQLRMEQRLDAVEEAAARRQIEIGRQASRIVALADLAAERAAEIAAQREELGALDREARELRGQLGAAEVALRDLTFQRDSADAGFAAAEARRLDLATLADRNRTTIATLQTRAAALEVRLADGERAASAAASAAERERARLAAALHERAAAASRLGADLDTATAQGAKLAADLAATRARLGEAEALLARSEAAREEALVMSGRQFARIAERDAASREGEAAKRDLADQLSLLTATQAILEGALHAERAERADLQREVDALRARPAAASPGGRTAGDQALRNAIARLGRDFARLNGKARGGLGEPSNLVSFDRREAQPHAAASETPHAAPAGKIRQGQPMAPER
jgi:chromosome segregation ATPase